MDCCQPGDVHMIVAVRGNRCKILSFMFDTSRHRPEPPYSVQTKRQRRPGNKSSTGKISVGHSRVLSSDEGAYVQQLVGSNAPRFPGTVIHWIWKPSNLSQCQGLHHTLCATRFSPLPYPQHLVIPGRYRLGKCHVLPTRD